jgi:TRAP-type C4-dicarboxylate transport system substrate-binding protein
MGRLCSALRACAVIALAATAGCRDAGDDGVTTLTYASPYAPSHPFSRADIAWMEHVEAASQGRLAIEPYWSGGVISSEHSMLEIRHGVVDIGLITPIYTRGGAHALRNQTGFYAGARTMQDQVDVYKCLQAEFEAIREELGGLRVLAVQGGNFPGVLTRGRPVASLDDLRGLRLRAPTEIVYVLEELGADPVNMPMGEVYSALAKNMIDGVVAPTDTMRSLSLAEVTDYYSELRFPRGAYPARAMSQARWESLPADLQALLDASVQVWEAALMRELEAALEEGARFGREAGLEFAPFSAEDQRRLDEVYNRSARRAAERLARRVPEGVAMYERTQEMIIARNHGARDQCPRVEEKEERDAPAP